MRKRGRQVSANVTQVISQKDCINLRFYPFPYQKHAAGWIPATSAAAPAGGITAIVAPLMMLGLLRIFQVFFRIRLPKMLDESSFTASA